MEDYDLAKLWVESQTDSNQHLSDQEGEHKNTSESKEKKLIWNVEGDKAQHMLMQPTLPDLNEMTRRKSSRAVKSTIKVHHSDDKVIHRMFGLLTASISPKQSKQSPIMLLLTHLENVKTMFDSSINECHFYICDVVASTNDVYTLKEMFRLKDIKDFVVAVMKEIEDHEERDHWMLYKRSEMPKGTKTILSVWAFKIKRLPDGTITNTQSTTQCPWRHAALVN